MKTSVPTCDVTTIKNKSISKMDLKLTFILLIIISFETLAQYFLQEGVNSDTNKNTKINVCIGVIFYALVGITYYFILLQHKKIAIANSLWNAGTGISITVLGLLVFKQRASIQQLMGIVIIIIGTTLL